MLRKYYRPLFWRILKTSDCSHLGGFGLFGTGAALWTASRSKFPQMLDLADFIRSQL